MLRCEYALWNVLPVIRKEIARILFEEYKMKQKDIASLLKIKKSTVSMYLSGKRGKKFKLNRKVLNRVRRLVEKVLREGYLKENTLCEICRMVVRDEGLLR